MIWLREDCKESYNQQAGYIISLEEGQLLVILLALQEQIKNGGFLQIVFSSETKIPANLSKKLYQWACHKKL